MTDAGGEDAGGDRPRMADVDHTHPETDQAFGTVYRRGPVVADGAGPAVARDPGDARVDGGTEETDRERMADVDHEAPHGDGARGVWARGDEDGGDDEQDEATVEDGAERTVSEVSEVSEVREGHEDE